jgi:acyl-CoA thioester hydrolase
MKTSGMKTFTWPVRVYWEDTDAGGIVYYANYMKFMERARTEWLRDLGFEQAALREEHGLIFVVVDLQAHYRKPAQYGDLLQVSCLVEEVTRASLTFAQQIHRDGVAGDLLLEGKVRVACLDALKYRPRPLPAALLQEMSE